MTWEAFIELVMQTAPMWGTALVSVASAVVCVVKAINRAKDAIDDFKADKTLKEVNDKLSEIAQKEEKLIKLENALINRITKIENYMEHKEHEEQTNKK